MLGDSQPIYLDGQLGGIEIQVVGNRANEVANIYKKKRKAEEGISMVITRVWTGCRGYGDRLKCREVCNSTRLTSHGTVQQLAVHKKCVGLLDDKILRLNSNGSAWRIIIISSQHCEDDGETEHFANTTKER